MHVRKISADELKNAKILNNDRIQSRLIQRFQRIKEFLLDLTVLKQGVYREIQLPAVWNQDKISYLSVPLGYRMWQKKESRLELAASMIRKVM